MNLKVNVKPFEASNSFDIPPKDNAKFLRTKNTWRASTASGVGWTDHAFCAFFQRDFAIPFYFKVDTSLSAAFEFCVDGFGAGVGAWHVHCSLGFSDSKVLRSCGHWKCGSWWGEDLEEVFAKDQVWCTSLRCWPHSRSFGDWVSWCQNRHIGVVLHLWAKQSWLSLSQGDHPFVFWIGFPSWHWDKAFGGPQKAFGNWNRLEPRDQECGDSWKVCKCSTCCRGCARQPPYIREDLNPGWAGARNPIPRKSSKRQSPTTAQRTTRH